jgi:hypothetical protein
MTSRAARRAHKKLIAQVNRARDSGKVCMPKKAEQLLLRRRPKKVSPMEKSLQELKLSETVSQKLIGVGAMTVGDVHRIFRQIQSGELEIRGLGPVRLGEVRTALMDFICPVPNLLAKFVR